MFHIHLIGTDRSRPALPHSGPSCLPFTISFPTTLTMNLLTLLMPGFVMDWLHGIGRNAEKAMGVIE